MKEKLKRIYADLASGKLSQSEALEVIKSVKAAEQAVGLGSLLFSAAWVQAARNAGDLARGEYSSRYIVLCELSSIDIEKLGVGVSPAHCERLRTESHRDIAQRYSEYAAACFDKIKAALGDRPRGRILMQVVVAGEGEQALFAGLSALLKTAALENPQFTGQLIVVESTTNTEELVAYLNGEVAEGGAVEAAVKYERGARMVWRWQEMPTDVDEPPVAFQDQRVYLITGGLGRLGGLFAREILRDTRETTVVVTGRAPFSAEKVERLSAQSDRIRYRQVDVGDAEQVARLIDDIRIEHGGLNGIIHCAGALADNFILKKSNAEFRGVLVPKVAGAFHLDQASRDLDLDFFVLFSSFAAAMGNLGQADYATANAFMDELATYRNQLVDAKLRHGRSRSIHWPLWQAGGMMLDTASLERLRQLTGMRPMQTEVGIRAFHRILASAADRVLVAEGELAEMRRALVADRSSVAESAPVASTVEGPGRLLEVTEEFLRRQCSEVLKLSFAKLDPQAALEAYGIDSIMAMKLTSHLEQTFGPLSKTLFFEYQTIRELTGYFVQHHAPRLAALLETKEVKRSVEPPAPRRPAIRPSTPSAGPLRAPRKDTEADAIAIIGLSGRYPEAVDVEAYWRNLRDGKDCVIEVPKERWDWREYFSEDRSQPGQHYSKWGGFISGVDEFDPLFFNISPREARFLDPQERLFLQHAWMAMEDAGYTRGGLQVAEGEDLPGQVGVYVGVMYTEYQLFGAESSVRGKRLGIAGSAASIANRVSYALNLHGPSLTLDTMCSSSLSAIHLGCEDLKRGRTNLAIAGGVNVSIHPNKYLVLSAGQFISSEGHCQSFGEGGDGYIPGEGVGVVILKRLSDAKRDGDHIYGVIRGSALNHGGKTNGYSVPNPQAQASAIGRALAEAEIDARQISYIEAHGTGTKLGDPIEVAALTKAFERYTEERGFCLIGSAKSNIGHCESAAGIAGLTKVLLQMQHGQIVPSLHSAELNPHIDFGKTPFVVNQTLREWERPVVEGRTAARMAGVSSFGAGGSNAHLIVEEYREEYREAEREQRLSGGKVLIVLSARSAGQLQQKARELMEYVSSRGETLDLAAVGYTLQVGREAMEERLGLVVSSAGELVEKLAAYVAGEEGLEEVYQGEGRRDRQVLSLLSSDGELRQTVGKWMANRQYSKLLELWVQGLEVDWSGLYGEARPRRVSLPTYPFAKERYWIEAGSGTAVRGSNAGAARAMLHPLVQSNTSDLSEQRYSSTFTGEEFFLADHQVGEQRMLPAVAYLEMVRAAIEQAVPQRAGTSGLELRDTVWIQPVVVAGESKRIHVALAANERADGIEYEIYSQEGDEEVVHCQGTAVWSDEGKPGRIELEALGAQMGKGRLEGEAVYAASGRMGLRYGPAMRGIEGIERGDGQVLARLRLPEGVEETWNEYVLHPSVMDGALQAAGALLGDAEPRVPFALESLRIVEPCSREMMAWVRHSAADTAKLDIDLCDQHGNVALQLRGFTWHPVPESATVVIDPAPVDAALPVRREIALVRPSVSTPGPVEKKKRTPISLAVTRSDSAARQTSEKRAPITLSQPKRDVSTRTGEATAGLSARLYDDGNGVFSIESVSSAHSPEMAAGMLQALETVRQESSLKVLLLIGLERGVARGPDGYNEFVEQGLHRALAAFPFPVIASLRGDAIGAAFLAASLCDFMVCDEDATYGYTDVQNGLYPGASEARLFAERFGSVRAQDFLYQAALSTGRQLRAKGWTCPIVASERVEAHARSLASKLATKSQEALRLLKQHVTRNLLPLVNELKMVDPPLPATEDRRPQSIEASSPYLRLDGSTERVLTITVGDVDAADLVRDLDRVFAEVRRDAYYKSIVLVSESSEFAANAAREAVLEFQRLVHDSEIPVVVALTGNATGNSWLMALLCDACVYNRDGLYSARGMDQDAVLVELSVAVMAHRLGSAAGDEVLLTGAAYRGTELQQRVGALLLAQREGVRTAALNVAELWSRMPRPALSAWKEHSSRVIRERVRTAAVERTTEDDAPHHPVTAPTAIQLRSKAVSATVYPGGVVEVRLEDREAKNMFSEDLLQGLVEVFARIEQAASCKVVILTGYDSYFASGGTKEQLILVQSGKARFTDQQTTVQLPLDCKVPVIAAIQGHGIGAGWVLGLFADLVVLSDESRYVSPYMDYGFTPGAGATHILPAKLGHDLARESLLTAQQSTGAELKARGLGVSVVPRADVVPAARSLAEKIAHSSRSRLVGLKRLMSQKVREELDEVYRAELAMHEKTFVGQNDTLTRIERTFGGAEKPSSAAVRPEPVQPSRAPSTGADVQAGAQAGVMSGLRELLANELQMRESDVDENVQFIDLGLDSVSGISWTRKINEKYRTSIEPSKVYSYPTLAQLSRHVQKEAERLGTLPNVVGAQPALAPIAIAPPSSPTAMKPAPTVRTTASRRRRAVAPSPVAAEKPAPKEAVAVIGMAGQFPQAKNLDEYWENIAQGRNCITRVTSDRWDVDAYYQPGAAVSLKTNACWLGALPDYDRFDPLFFNISPNEALNMDPQQRLFLQACWHSIENAGYAARTLSGSKTGVFVGCTPGDYHLTSRAHQLSAHGFIGSASSILPARISYFLNLRGPCVAIDTACSSSLVAIAQACDSLLSGASDLALAGGVYVMSGPEMHIRAAQAGMLSPEGNCFTFDQRADGFVIGEGVGAVVLKRLSDAERDRDTIYGIVEGWGVNQDGRTNGITAPNPESQTLLEQDVYDRYRIDPAKIQLIEAHGTGTKLGDPIEVEGLNQAFAKFTNNKQYCALGSVKSNIGHCLTAAGAAGFIKVLLALQHKQLPPTINFERLNEHIGLADSPFYVNTQLRDWELDGNDRRRGAISSFGFSGTNAHVVIGEYLPPAEAKSAVPVVTLAGKAIVPLSARTEERLRQKASDLLHFIRHEAPSVDLTEMAYTLQVGREAMDERAAFVASSVAHLAEQLEAFLGGQSVTEGVHRDSGRRSKEGLGILGQDDEIRQAVLEKWFGQGQVAKLADLWVKGLDLEWSRLYGDARPRRITLPLYPFAKERFWIDVRPDAPDAERPPVASAAFLHPLLQRNTSNLNGQRYSSTLTGDEFFCNLAAGKVLSPMASLEMARAAIEDSLPAIPENSVLELRAIAWTEPIVVVPNRQVGIALSADDDDVIEFEIYSHDGEREIIHCHGRAVLSERPAAAKLDFRQQSEAIEYLRVPAAVETATHGFILHPSVMEAAVRAASARFGGGLESGQSWTPTALESLRIISPCTAEMVASVRPSGSRATDVDIDLCDERGNICVEVRGLATGLATKKVAGDGAVRGMFAGAVWQPVPLEAHGQNGAGKYVEHHVILCDLPGLAEHLPPFLPRAQCLSLAAGVHKNIGQRYSEYAVACLDRIQGILRAGSEGSVLVQIVVPGDSEHAPIAGLSGLLRTATLESRRLVGQVITVPADIAAGDVCLLLQEEMAGRPEPLVKYEHGVRQILCLQEVGIGSQARPNVFRDPGVYLITGGLGGLGILFAKEILAQTRQTRVVLTGRRDYSADKQKAVDRLFEHSDRVTYREARLDELDHVRRLIGAIRKEYGRLDGVLHSAGMVADDLIANKSASQFAEVLAPKVIGTCNLDEATADVPLDLFVLFSSIAGMTGNPGQADYAAANAFLDHFAASRNAQVAAGLRHGRTLSINWGAWKNGGMRVAAANQELLRQMMGMEAMDTVAGLQAFYQGLSSPYDQVLAVAGEPARIRNYLAKAQVRQASGEGSAAVPYRYANKAEEFYADVASRAGAEFKEEYLTFAPFEEKRPGFSMSQLLVDPDSSPDDARHVLSKQIEMRQVLFCGENLATLTSCLDFGCGYGTDVIQIGELFPHLQVHGYTITRDQAALGNRRIALQQLPAERVRIYHADSSQDPFPSRYDLIFGVEVSFHIRDKAGLFSNVCNSLNEGGRVLLADYISNLPGSVDDPNIEISIPTAKEWVALLSQFGLEIDELIDVSREIANFLYDPGFNDHVAMLPDVSRKTLKNYANQSASLERGWISYVLLKLRRNAAWDREQLERHNWDKIQHPTPYRAAVQAMLAREHEHILYPPSDVASGRTVPVTVGGPTADHRHAEEIAEAPFKPREVRKGGIGADELREELKGLLSAVLGMDKAIIDVDRPFIELGLDSFLGVEMMLAVNKRFGTELSNVKLFDYPTVREFSGFLASEIVKMPGLSSEPPAAEVRPTSPAAESRAAVRTGVRAGRARTRPGVQPDMRIAIVGMSGRYPKADDLGQYWSNLARGRDCIGEVPRSRWDVDRYYDPDPKAEGKTNSKWLGALDDVECFDPLFFRISPQEAAFMDPQHRLFLQESYRAFEDAGYAGSVISSKKCGIYLGISTNDYELVLVRNGVLPESVTSNSHAIGAARIAYYLNLKGPAISIDTACSSSLVAIHLACQALLNGETAMALAGGVGLWLAPESYLAMSHAGMFSPVGRCKTFDDTADGIVVGEAVGAVVLKRLKDAEADNDVIHGVILGSGVNQDGKTNGITAPNAQSQMELLRDVYAKYQIDPETISYVETHGTGTRLGDPIELAALATVFGEKSARKNFCALASVKSNIGHTSSAAGIAGVQKVLLSMKHRTLAPSLHVTRGNSHFDFENSPFFVNQETRPWEVASGGLRRAAVSSFGFSGTNAHLVIEEYPVTRPRSGAARNVPCIVPLSARAPEQLQQKSRELLDYLRTAQAPVDLDSVAYTLQVGREAMEERLGFVVTSIDQLSQCLGRYLDGATNVEGLVRGRVETGGDGIAAMGSDEDMRPTIERWLERRKLTKLLDLWVRGVSLDWNKLYGDEKPRRVSLPAYPFARERCWIDGLQPERTRERDLAVDETLKSMEEIIDQISADLIEPELAVTALKMLV